jgi:hypothetical protein
VSRPGGGQADLSDGISLIIEEYGLGRMSYFMDVRFSFCMLLLIVWKAMEEGSFIAGNSGELNRLRSDNGLFQANPASSFQS